VVVSIPHLRIEIWGTRVSGGSDLGHPPIAAHVPGEDVALSVVTLIELAHGVARANTPERKCLQQQFLRELMTALPVHPVSAAVALRAGQIDGENSAECVRLALSDLLIGVTALELGYGVATGNVRHFEMIPGLRVVVL
jgi:predicted nucleic acid-binding protein